MSVCYSSELARATLDADRVNGTWSWKRESKILVTIHDFVQYRHYYTLGITRLIATPRLVNSITKNAHVEQAQEPLVFLLAKPSSLFRLPSSLSSPQFFQALLISLPQDT